MRTCTIDQTVHTETWSTLTRLVLVDTWAHVCSPGCAAHVVDFLYSARCVARVQRRLARSAHLSDILPCVLLLARTRVRARARPARETTEDRQRDRGGARRSREAISATAGVAAHLGQGLPPSPVCSSDPPRSRGSPCSPGLAGSSDPLLTWRGAHLTPLLTCNTWLARGSPRLTVVPGCKRFMHSNRVRQLGDIN